MGVLILQSARIETTNFVSEGRDPKMCLFLARDNLLMSQHCSICLLSDHRTSHRAAKQTMNRQSLLERFFIKSGQGAHEIADNEKENMIWEFHKYKKSGEKNMESERVQIAETS
mmetsp:Transcript_43200/g.92186  ORF Transcript_43200/g.92186 Transcript_43200/m.92186 type:complete len:114 (+) Transcript_43200:621-962(+)